jgi:hypothetical protein
MPNRGRGRSKNKQQQATHQSNPATSATTLVKHSGSDHSDQPHSNNIYARNEHEENLASGWLRNPNWWMVILTAAVAVAAGISGWIFYLQWNQMHEAMIQERRAWVVPTINVPKQAVHQGNTLNISVHLTNTGDTPATHIHSEIAVEVVSKGSSPVFSYPTPDTENTVGICSRTSRLIFQK